jgi:hypothetical protein
VKRLIPIILAMAALLAACDDGSGDTGPRGDAPWWLLIVVVGGLVVVLVSLLVRGAKRDRAPDLTIWKNNARTGYAQARWLYDAMGEELAVWRGTVMAGSDEVESTSSLQAGTWSQLPRRYDTALDALYRLEAAAPDNRTSNASRAVSVSLRSTRAALDDRADARRSHLAQEAGDAEALKAARDREVRTSMNLATQRRSFAEAIDRLGHLA